MADMQQRQRRASDNKSKLLSCPWWACCFITAGTIFATHPVISVSGINRHGCPKRGREMIRTEEMSGWIYTLIVCYLCQLNKDQGPIWLLVWGAECCVTGILKGALKQTYTHVTALVWYLGDLPCGPLGRRALVNWVVIPAAYCNLGIKDERFSHRSAPPAIKRDQPLSTLAANKIWILLFDEVTPI